MAKNPSLKTLKDADDILKILTGKRIKDIAPLAIDLFGKELINSLLKRPKTATQANDPWTILEINPDASDFIVQAAYRAMARKYHPDNKETGNEAMFIRIQTAYEAILTIRKNKGEG